MSKIITALVTASLASGVALAKRAPGTHFMKFDLNRDGRITLTEFHTKHDEYIAFKDYNGDEIITMAEFNSNRANDELMNSFESHDENGDGCVTKYEYYLVKMQNFNRIDFDGNKEVTKYEVKLANKKPNKKPKPSVNNAFKNVDFDNDGSISMKELARYMGVKTTKYANFDADNNNYITVDEFRTGLVRDFRSFDRNLDAIVAISDFKNRNEGLRFVNRYTKKGKRSVYVDRYVKVRLPEFHNFDKNNSKSLDPSELSKYTSKIDKLFKSLDKNKNGKISKSEFGKTKLK